MYVKLANAVSGLVLILKGVNKAYAIYLGQSREVEAANLNSLATSYLISE
jgi:hypothetical protein